MPYSEGKIKKISFFIGMMMFILLITTVIFSDSAYAAAPRVTSYSASYINGQLSASLTGTSNAAKSTFVVYYSTKDNPSIVSTNSVAGDKLPDGYWYYQRAYSDWVYVGFYEDNSKPFSISNVSLSLPSTAKWVVIKFGVTNIYNTWDNYHPLSSKLDAAGPTASSCEYNNLDSTGYDVYVYGVSDASAGVNTVRFPTWTDVNGQDDLIWHVGTNQGGGTWKYHVNKSEHNNEGGLYYTHIYGYDNVGNYRYLGGVSAVIDITPPAVPTFSANPTTPTSGTVNITINYSADSMVKQYKIGTTGTYTNYASQIPVTTNNTIIYAKARDAAGNWCNEVSYTVTNIDKTAPTITLTQSPATWTKDDVTVTANISDANGIAVQKYADGNRNAGYFNTNGTLLTGTTFIVGTNGDYTVYARDNLGNAAVKTINITNIDKIAPSEPTVTTTAPVGYVTGNYTNQDVTVNIVNGADSGSGAVKSQYSFDNGTTWCDYWSPFTIAIEGTFVIWSRTLDNAGNISSNDITTIKIDKTPVSGTVVMDNGATDLTDATVLLTFTKDFVATRDINDVHEIWISNDNFITCQKVDYEDQIPNWSIDTTTGGTKTIYVKYLDWVGNLSTVFTDTINYMPPPRFISCDQYGNIDEDVVIFGRATINIPDSGIDTTGNFIYCGVDVGIFKKPVKNQDVADHPEWEWPKVVDAKRIYTDKKEIHIDDFGDADNSEYKKNEVYVIGYRLLYAPVSEAIENGEISSVIETKWVKVLDSYFELAPDLPMSKVEHNQLITYIYNGGVKTVEVAKPEITTGEYGITTQEEVNAYNSYNRFIDGDYVKYRLKFNVIKANIIDKVDVTLKLNSTDLSGVELHALSAKLGKIQGGTTSYIRDLTVVGTGETETFSLDSNDITNNATYFIEYACRLNVAINSGEPDIVRNVAEINVVDTEGNNIPISILSEEYKNYIDTDILKSRVNYA